MPLHRNENASQKTLAFKGLDTYVKENYMLSRERATLFTQTSSDSSIDLKPEFVFKGKGTRTKLNRPSGIKFQWSESGSYRIDQLKQTIMNLPNRFNPFTCKDVNKNALFLDSMAKVFEMDTVRFYSATCVSFRACMMKLVET